VYKTIHLPHLVAEKRSNNRVARVATKESHGEREYTTTLPTQEGEQASPLPRQPLTMNNSITAHFTLAHFTVPFNSIHLIARKKFV
jgi:hypothetical protein